MEQTLTAKQEQILNCIKQSLKDKGYPPSVRELCLAVGLSSTSTVHSHLNTLEKKGYIRRDPSKPRTIEVLDEEVNWISEHVSAIPVLGKVTAGAPILAVENIEEYFPLPKQLTRHDETFMLNVRGTSMINAGIYDGDQIIVRKQDSANNGEIVVALIGDEVTVKRFFKEKDCVRLQPENDSMDPIYCEDVHILGKVIGLIRIF
ncbi:MAG: transcriptional repressor LexA [Candidatus Cellulosilyticum pullistercoris]|uniref:LexA repressor n=1 Tax=Candidatus Cellulosilyticum pullistercoris TaxID=2838521 RepID=A0A9E2KDF8_9FIRM|nr:transcriptional repressor LexA [Candidatus Cellulosilyticum pullistercoris]